ncbi:AAA family ATPase [Trinickia sp.]|uniref:AAA family ATPase n=1 Tax=Trinickia sp. TaxID=2571163 RepID=UPI003F81864A
MINSITLTNFLSYGPAARPVELRALNVIIGPNGSGKSNLIEAFELLRATPRDLLTPAKVAPEPVMLASPWAKRFVDELRKKMDV